MTDCGQRCAKNSGFSMVEVIVSLFLIVLILGGGYRVIVQSSKLSRVARNSYIAETLCKNRIERARNFDYGDLHLLEETATVVNDSGYPDAAGWFSRSTTVTPDFLTNCTKVAVTVQVKNRKTGGFGPQEESMDMLFTEYLAPITP